MNFIQKINELTPDFSWAENHENYDVEANERNPHDCKDELSKQWNGDLIPATTEEGSTRRMREARVRMVQSVRDMMNAGCRLDVIRNRIAKNNKKEIVALFQPDIDKQLKLYGSVGRFILDARGYKSCKDAYASALKNPYRKYFGYVMGCGCKEHVSLSHMPRKASFDLQMPQSYDMVASCIEDKTERKNFRACMPTSLVVIAGAGDIDEQWAGDTMIDLMNASSTNKEGNEKAVKTITAGSGKPYDKLKRFFIAFESGSLLPGDSFEEREGEFTTAPSIFVEIPENQIETPDVEMPVKNDKISLFEDLETVDVGDIDGNKMDIDLVPDVDRLSLEYGSSPAMEIPVSEGKSGLEDIGNEEVGFESSNGAEISIPETKVPVLKIELENGFQEELEVPEEEPFEITF